MFTFNVWLEARKRKEDPNQKSLWDFPPPDEPDKLPEPEPVVLPMPPKKRSSLMRQRDELKQRHPGMMILFRMGDFYELFGEDAENAAKVLSITLTYRQDGDEKIPMVGFPRNTLEIYLKKLLQSGLRIAVAEQT